MKQSTGNDTYDLGLGEWCTEDELPEETRCKVEGLKTMARWLLGLKQDVASAQKTFRMLNAFITHNGEFVQFSLKYKTRIFILILYFR